jgi:hypothetical protein
LPHEAEQKIIAGVGQKFHTGVVEALTKVLGGGQAMGAAAGK